MSKYETVWSINEYVKSITDGEYVQLGDCDRRILEDALINAANADGLVETQYYTERLQATHLFIHVIIPEDIENYDNPDDITWWDFAAVLAKQVGGEWYLWSEDPGDIGNEWYQSTYTKAQAYAVRDAAIQWAKEDRIYAGDYMSDDFYQYVKSNIMTFW